MSCEHRIDAGAYALGALDAEDATAFAAHLEGCRACREELRELQATAAAVALAAPQVSPPPALRERIMRDVRAGAELRGAASVPRAPARPRARWRALVTVRPAIAAAIACALLALGVGAGLLAQGGGEDTRTLAALVGARGASASLRVRGDEGSLVVDRMPSPPAGDVYQVWVVKADGRPRPTHTLFNVRDDGRATVAIDASLDGVRQVLVTSEPSGGSQVPSGDPVITASLS